MAPTAVFDINETTLDLTPVRVAVETIFDRRGAFETWFTRLLQLSMATSATGEYADFSELARSALGSVAQTEGRPLPRDAPAILGSAMASLRAYPDVADGLDRLRAEGWVLFALTNSAPAAVESQLDSAGIADRFDRILSVEAARVYKPRAEAYAVAIDAAGIDPAEMWMVAAHDWDLAGAKAVGMSTAFITRPNMPFADVYPAPDLTVASFGALADTLLD